LPNWPGHEPVPSYPYYHPYCARIPLFSPFRVHRRRNRWTPLSAPAPISPVSPSRYVDIHIDLARIRTNAQATRSQAGVPVIAVVKADAYGHGIVEVTDALRDLIDEFCVFALSEVVDARIWERTQRRTLVSGPPLKAMEPE